MQSLDEPIGWLISGIIVFVFYKLLMVGADIYVKKTVVRKVGEDKEKVSAFGVFIVVLSMALLMQIFSDNLISRLNIDANSFLLFNIAILFLAFIILWLGVLKR